MKSLFAPAVSVAAALATGVASAQSGSMMNGGHWGGGRVDGYGGAWVPVLLVVVGLVAGSSRRAQVIAVGVNFALQRRCGMAQ